jgi:hypothetical protein
MLLRFYIRYRRKINLYLNNYMLWFFAFLLISFNILSTLIVSFVVKKDTNIIQANLVNFTYLDSSYLQLRSNNSIGEIKIREDGKENNYLINVNDKNLDIDRVDKPYELATEEKGNNIINFILKINSKKTIEYIRLYLIAPKDKYPLDSNYIFQEDKTFSRSYDKKNQVVYKFYIGRNAENNFVFNISLLTGNYVIYADIEYPFIDPSNAEFEKYNAVILKKSIFHEKFNIAPNP